ncbi:MAG: hypothetical protein AB7O26_09280 [Planctomycetaceae bacterium]
MEPTDKEKQRPVWRAYTLWTLFLVFAIYPLSAFPVSIMCLWLIKAGVIPNEPTKTIFQTFYAPVGWVLNNFPSLDSVMQFIADLVEKIVPVP